MLLVIVINSEINLKGETLNDGGEKNYIQAEERFICVQKVERKKLKGYPVSKGLSCNNYHEIDSDRYMVGCQRKEMIMRERFLE
jgi:hypothetical protein